MRRLVGMIYGWLLSTELAAQQSAPKFAAPSAAVAPQEIAADTGFIQIFGSLLLVIATIVAIGWFARRIKSLPRRSSSVLRIVDEVVLGAKERAVLLEVDGARLVLGVGDGRVSLLHRGVPTGDTNVVSTPEASSRTAAGIEQVPQRFAELLKRGLGR